MMTWRSKEWIGKIWKERHYMKIKEKIEIHPLVMRIRGQTRDLHLVVVVVVVVVVVDEVPQKAEGIEVHS